MFVDIAAIQCIRVPGIGVQVASHLEEVFERKINVCPIIICPVILGHDTLVQDLGECILNLDVVFDGWGARLVVTIWRLLVMVEVLVHSFFIIGGPVIVLSFSPS
jgi:hypothetical protein